MSDDFLSKLDQPDRKRKRAFNTPPSTAAVTRDDANKASGGSQRMHGRKKQLNTRMTRNLFDDTMERIKAHAEALQLSQNDVQLWALLRGLQALDDGEEPNTRARAVRRALKL